MIEGHGKCLGIGVGSGMGGVEGILSSLVRYI